MKTLFDWIGVFRLKNGLFSVAVAYTCLKIQPFFENINNGNLITFLVVVFLGVSLAMSQNDYVDRKKDITAGKRFAMNNANMLLNINVIICGIGTILTATLVKTELNALVSVLLVQIVVSWFYSYTQRILFLPTIIVALAMGSLAFFPYFLPGTDTNLVWMISIILTLMILVREIIMDTHEVNIDNGFKKTIPLTFGDKAAARTCYFLLVIISVMLMLFDLRNILVLFPIIATIIFLQRKDYELAKNCSSLTLLFFFATLYVIF